MERVSCLNCKYAPDSFIWSDYCNKKIDKIYTSTRIIDVYAKRIKHNSNNNCIYYEDNIIKKIITLIKKLFR